MTAAAERINQYTKRKKELEYELAKTASHTEYTVGHFRDYLAHVSKSLDSKLNPFQAKKIIDTYVEKIILYPDGKVEVILKLSLPSNDSGKINSGSEYNVGAEGTSLTYTHRFRLNITSTPD